MSQHFCQNSLLGLATKSNELQILVKKEVCGETKRLLLLWVVLELNYVRVFLWTSLWTTTSEPCSLKGFSWLSSSLGFLLANTSEAYILAYRPSLLWNKPGNNWMSDCSIRLTFSGTALEEQRELLAASYYGAHEQNTKRWFRTRGGNTLRHKSVDFVSVVLAVAFFPRRKQRWP